MSEEQRHPGEPILEAAPEEPVVVPVAEERVRVDKRVVTTGVVRVIKRVRTEPVHVEELLRQEDLVVERVPVEQLVDEAPGPYTDGDTWVLPVVEEVLVRRFLVREELRVTRRVHTRPVVEELERRIEEVEVVREDGDGTTRDPVR